MLRGDFYHKHDTDYTREKVQMSRSKGPFQKEKLVFQASFFRGEVLVFGGSKENTSDPITIDPTKFHLQGHL